MSDSLTKRTESVASLKAFLGFLATHQETLLGKQEKFDQIRRWFSEGTTIDEQQHQFIIDSISSTHEPGQALCGLIESRAYQAFTNRLRYPLADALYRLNEQSDELLFRLSTFPISRSGLVVQREKLRAIRQKVLGFMHTLDEILGMIFTLRSQLYFQEKKPVDTEMSLNKPTAQITDIDQYRMKSKKALPQIDIGGEIKNCAGAGQSKVQNSAHIGNSLPISD